MKLKLSEIPSDRRATITADYSDPEWAASINRGNYGGCPLDLHRLHPKHRRGVHHIEVAWVRLGEIGQRGSKVSYTKLIAETNLPGHPLRLTDRVVAESFLRQVDPQVTVVAPCHCKKGAGTLIVREPGAKPLIVVQSLRDYLFHDEPTFQRVDGTLTYVPKKRRNPWYYLFEVAPG